MNLNWIAFLALLPFAALADGFTGPGGENRLGQKIYVTELFQNGKFNGIGIEVHSGKPLPDGSYGPAERQFMFDEECAYSGKQRSSEQRDHHQKLVCKKTGKSPLAGATYKITPAASKCGGWNFECIDGCDRQETPLYMHEDFYECSNEDGADCPRSAATSGIVRTTKLNLRETPEFDGRVLRPVSYATRVRILRRNDACLAVPGAPTISGQWVKVHTRDDAAIQEGWLFDAYLEYFSDPE